MKTIAELRTGTIKWRSKVDQLEFSDEQAEVIGFDPNSFWERLVAKKDDDLSVRVNGVCYRIGEETQRSRHQFRGFGGSPFVILYKDGTIRRSTNLWHNGDVPESHKDKLPDNAVFLYAGETPKEWDSTRQRDKSRIFLHWNTQEGKTYLCRYNEVIIINNALVEQVDINLLSQYLRNRYNLDYNKYLTIAVLPDGKEFNFRE